VRRRGPSGTIVANSEATPGLAVTTALVLRDTKKASRAMQNTASAANSSPRSDAVLTTRPVRLLLVGRVKPGAEPALRRVQAAFPREAATEAGIDAVEAFIGSGTYAVQLEIGRDDVQQVLADFLNDPRVRAFRDQLEPVTEGLPGPDYHFGTAPAANDASGQTVYHSGDLHFAASMYRWRAD
jgi:hypothetical protein